MCDKFGWKVPHVDNFCTFSSPNEIHIHTANMYWAQCLDDREQNRQVSYSYGAYILVTGCLLVIY